MATRTAPRAPKNAPASVAKQAKVEADRKKASKAALHAALDTKKPKTPKVEATKPAAPVKSDADKKAQKAAEHEAYLAALRVDAAALGVDPEQYIAEQTGHTGATAYTGPMLVLRAAAKTYTKGVNGNPHCNDRVAQAFTALKPADTIRVCMELMGLENNPYIHLNIGQQSMNLRNKLRGQIKAGAVSVDAVVEAAQSIKE